jgi:exonuclease III
MSELLSVFNWNVRRLNMPARREAFHEMVQSVRPMLVCLQETKLSLINQQLASEILGHNLDGYCYLPVNGTKGGILVGWQTDHVEATNCVLKDFSLSVEIKFKFGFLAHLSLWTYRRGG